MSIIKTLYDENIEGVVLCNDLQQKVFNLRNAPHFRVGFTKNQLFKFSPVFIFRKKSMFRRMFNDKITMLQESGHIEFWTKNYTDNRAPKTKVNQPAKQLRMGNIAAVFQICGAIYLVSFVVFIMEIMSKRCKRLKQFIDYLTY